MEMGVFWEDMKYIEFAVTTLFKARWNQETAKLPKVMTIHKTAWRKRDEFRGLYPLTLSWIRGVRGHSPIFKQKHSILGLDFDFAYKELIWNKNYHFKSKNNQFINILSFEQKFY